MSLYFSRFPIINYNGKFVRDITRRTNFKESNFADPFLFLPYTVKQGERPEDVAYFYYGSVDYTWLVLMANDIHDVYREWMLDVEALNRFIANKYEKRSGRKGSKVVEWAMDETRTDNIMFYYNEQTKIKINNESITHVDNPSDYRAIRIYEFEDETNNAKGEIKLVDRAQLRKIDQQFKSLILR